MSSVDAGHIEALHIQGWQFIDSGKVSEALAVAQRGMAAAPHDPRFVWLRGFAGLLLGDFRQGWNDYEARWLVPGRPRAQNDFPVPQWRGQDLRGKSIYLHPEQGLGDSIQFVRYVPLVQERAANVLLATPPELESLFARSFPDVHLVRSGQPIPAFQFHCPLMSLPRARGTVLETIPANVPYLRADPLAVKQWTTRLAQFSGLKVGLAWAGGPMSTQNPTRSMHLSILRTLAGIEGVRFVSLQKGEPAAEQAHVPELDLLDFTGGLRDFSDTAALVSALDLVISVCTSAAHLSGALARPTWTLLAFAADFRWMLNRDDSPWYPTMRLFRQPAAGDWPALLSRVRGELMGWSTSHAAAKARL